jgi:hypothetical protein
MPNIIEQQDLLKGLPDTRLMTLLQNPVGDIPPFLVAAEAQRRQQIRQQFAGSGSKESVVDTLTKQLANVPQNVNAPARTPPMIPQTPQMQGVMALQQQQAMTDIAQQAQPQTMRSGGMVQRYQSQGLVIPTVDSLAASITGMSLEEYKRRLEAERIAKLGPGKAKFLLENPTLPRSEAEKARQEFYAATEGPLSSFYSPESAYAAAQEVEEKATPKNRIFPTLPPGSSGGMNFTPAQPKGAPQGGPEAAVEMQPKEGETPDEYRARLEKILAAQQPSDWEKAQGYFAMAEQFLDPSKTTMQSLVGAGQAFAQSAGEQARAQREAKLALERGLLEYDMEKAQSREEAEQNASKNRVESFKYQADQALREADLYRKAADDAKSELNDYIKSLDMAPEANDPRVVELRKRIQDANGKLNEAVRRSQYYNYQYGKTFGTYGTPTFWDPANPDVLSQ